LQNYVMGKTQVCRGHHEHKRESGLVENPV
jgi:hypothetical protein